MGYLIVALLAVVVAVFAMQNTTPVTVKFIVWQLADLPVAAIVLGSLAAGIVIAGLPLGFWLWRARSRLRALEPRAPAPGGATREPGSPPPRREAP